MIELNTKNHVRNNVRDNVRNNVYQNLCDNFTYDVRVYVSTMLQKLPVIMFMSMP